MALLIGKTTSILGVDNAKKKTKQKNKNFCLI
jgi:hypothetical protein